MNRHGHPLVVVMDATDEFRKMRLDVAQRKHSHSQKYDQKSGVRQNKYSEREREPGRHRRLSAWRSIASSSGSNPNSPDLLRTAAGDGELGVGTEQDQVLRHPMTPLAWTRSATHSQYLPRGHARANAQGCSCRRSRQASW